MKADPFGFGTEVPPNSASVVADIHELRMAGPGMASTPGRDEPGWTSRSPFTNCTPVPGCKHEHGTALNYRELAQKLVPYVKDMGYTHIELMPIMEHPFSGSWGYQVIGYFAPTSRFGSPHDFMYFVDHCHQAGSASLWTGCRGTFPKMRMGLPIFDGTALYEHADPRLGEHKEWGTLIFNYGRNEVKIF